MSSINKAGRNWTREARRSAPARIANLDIASSGIEPRQRHSARTQVNRRGQLDVPVNDGDEETKGRRQVRRRRSRSPGADEDDEEGYSPVLRMQTKDFSRMGTGDILLEEDDSDASYDSFNLGLKKKALFEIEEPAGLISPSNTSEPLSQAQPSSAMKAEERDKMVQVYRVYRSHYEGDIFHDGNLSAELLTGTNRKMFQHELSKPLYRWMHVRNPTMAFNTFVAVVLDSPWLDSTEKDNAASILRIARQNSDKSLRMPPGKQGSYVEPEYYEETINQTVFHGFRSRRQKKESIKWICMPYFVSGEQPSANAKSSKPKDTSDLDLPPVSFLNTGYILDGKYFQCAQLWCLMIGDGLVVTCARRSIDELPGNLIHAKALPPADPQRRNVGDRAPVIIVSDGGIRTWLLPIDSCKTWPEFEANFAELGVDFFDGWDLLYQEMKINQKDWPRVISLAQKASIRLVLARNEDGDETEDTEIDSSSDENVQPSKSQTDVAAASVESSVAPQNTNDPHLPLIKVEQSQDPFMKEATDDTWHVFTLLATSVTETESVANGTPTPGLPKATPTLVVDEKVLQDDSDEINNYLFSINKRRGESIAWEECPTRAPHDIEKYLTSLDTTPDIDRLGLNHAKVQLFKAAKKIITFFYPLDYDHMVTQKFWGAVDRIIESEETNKSPSRFRRTVHNVRFLASVIEDLKEELFSKRTPTYNQTNVPHEFIQAWLMCLMYFVLYTTSEASRSSTYLKRVRTLLTQGKMKVIRRLQTVSLRDREAVSPLGISSLLIGQLLQDTRGQPLFPDRHRLASLYWRDIQALTNEVHNNPLSRRYQDKFVSLKQELDTIVGILEDQQRVLVALDDSINEGEAKSVIVESLNKLQGREASVIEFCLQSAEETLQNFVEMARRTSDLESWHFRMVESNKDRQEKAALTFTTVTVLFLPLTLLASIFGMNTNDIRNMTLNQWVFWAIAVPLCAVGLTLWLLYLGSFRNWARSLRDWRMKKQGL